MLFGANGSEPVIQRELIIGIPPQSLAMSAFARSYSALIVWVHEFIRALAGDKCECESQCGAPRAFFPPVHHNRPGCDPSGPGEPGWSSAILAYGSLALERKGAVGDIREEIQLFT